MFTRLGLGAAVKLTALLLFVLLEALNVRKDRRIIAKGEEAQRERPHFLASDNGLCGIVDKEQNPSIGGDGLVLGVFVKGCDVDDFPARGMPDRMVRRQEIAAARRDESVTERPAVLRASACTANLLPDVGKTVCGDRPRFRGMKNDTELLFANGTGEGLDSIVRIRGVSAIDLHFAMLALLRARE